MHGWNVDWPRSRFALRPPLQYTRRSGEMAVTRWSHDSRRDRPRIVASVDSVNEHYICKWHSTQTISQFE